MNSEYQVLKSTYTSQQSQLAAEVIKIAGMFNARFVSIVLSFVTLQSCEFNNEAFPFYEMTTCVWQFSFVPCRKLLRNALFATVVFCLPNVF